METICPQYAPPEECRVLAREARVIDTRTASEVGGVQVLIGLLELDKLSVIRARIGYADDNVPYGKTLRLIINVAYNNLDAKIPDRVFINTHKLRRPLDPSRLNLWARVILSDRLFRKVLSLTEFAAQGLLRVFPDYAKGEFIYLIKEPRLGIAFSLALFEYFLDNDWRGAVYEWRGGRKRRGRAGEPEAGVSSPRGGVILTDSFHSSPTKITS